MAHARSHTSNIPRVNAIYPYNRTHSIRLPANCHHQPVNTIFPNINHRRGERRSPVPI
jgi:hypothetical protein